jgi:hypothetical protein
MGFLSYQDINEADADKFYSSLTPDSKFLYSKVKKKNIFFSKKRIKNISARSLLPTISDLWAGLSSTDKAFFNSLSTYSGMTGWRLFVSEMSIRLKLSLSVPFLPHTSHQGWVGRLTIGGSARQIKIAQFHPATYYIKKKVVGSKGLYRPVLITENMSLPLDIGISYKCNLSASGTSQIARFYAVVVSSYQAREIENVVEIPFTNDNTWHIATASLDKIKGYFVSYTLYIHIFGYTGDVFFDNVKAIHGGTNWARDRNCSNIKASFSNQWYQVPKNWVALEIPSGAVYDVDYID